MKDAARAETDRKLKRMEHDISRIYATDPALKRITRDINEYMEFVKKETSDLYQAYMAAKDRDEKADLKLKYSRAVKELTLNSKRYKQLIKRFVKALSRVNQIALDVSNDAMLDIYVINYNQVAADCKKVGIKVDGE